MDGMDEMVEARDGMDGWKDREGGGIVPGDRRHNTEILNSCRNMPAPPWIVQLASGEDHVRSA